MGICRICGKEIPPNSRATKLCSEECRKQAKYQRDRAWFRANPEKAAAYVKKNRAENIEYYKKYARERYRQKCLEKIKKNQS